MKRHFRLIAAGVGLAALISVSVLWRWISSPVRIRVENRSNASAEHVEIQDRRGNLAVSAKSIPPGEFLEIQFPPTGEADFVVNATVKGERRSSEAVYSDQNKSFKFVIEQSSIKYEE